LRTTSQLLSAALGGASRQMSACIKRFSSELSPSELFSELLIAAYDSKLSEMELERLSGTLVK